MKSICFCFQLHIPLILRNYRFFEIGQHHEYFDDDELAAYLKQKTKNVLVPFIEMLQLLHLETNGKFKAGISISGTTLQHLQKSSPEVIQLLKELLQNNCIEFLSEPWSHSLLPFTSDKLLKQETRRHDKLIQELFGTRPKVLFAYVPYGLLPLLNSSELNKRNGTITYTNSLFNKKKDINNITPHLPDDRRIFFIDAKISQKFGKIDFNPNFHTLAVYTSGIAERINRNALSYSPSIIVFNPGQKARPFNLNHVLVWKTEIQKLLHDYQFEYLYPSQVIEHYNHPVSNANCSEKFLNRYRSTDFWLHSKLQREVFSKQKAIHAMLQKAIYSPLHSKWENIQDMDHLLFISDNYFKESFAANYFTPYSSPYMAYINYMNVLEDIYSSLKKELHQPIFQTKIHKKKRYVTAD
ncbi:polysaccharide deacetylase family protein [Draconibacterium mangrovi]|uniref:hypothetical protein n=1 Tax=Draconibacterium mangrovi TaxID=2697469 RepID=UPI0013D6A8E2|nr:hypothetical protein [Draconibacterium mangrovi]